MREEFIKEDQILEKTKQQTREELVNSLRTVRNNLMSSYNNMKYAEEELVDYYIYKIKAEEAQYAYLLKKMKQEE